MSVINIKDAPSGWESDPKYVYIGRAGHGKSGVYGNPFRLPEGLYGQADESARAQVLVKYAYWLSDKIGKVGPESAYAPWKLAKLADKTLVCFCAPLPCHGDILLNVAKVLYQYEGPLD